mmetsp:Transcript_2945/g.9034  ORF Transcript_2945/g.9034 Transcript_2945/m.9034 type:complete len:245 (-) Transcript_2945:371-1105(-)
MCACTGPPAPPSAVKGREMAVPRLVSRARERLVTGPGCWAASISVRRMRHAVSELAASASAWAICNASMASESSSACMHAAAAAAAALSSSSPMGAPIRSGGYGSPEHDSAMTVSIGYHSLSSPTSPCPCRRPRLGCFGGGRVWQPLRLDLRDSLNGPESSPSSARTSRTGAGRRTKAEPLDALRFMRKARSVSSEMRRGLESRESTLNQSPPIERSANQWDRRWHRYPSSDSGELVTSTTTSS